MEVGSENSLWQATAITLDSNPTLADEIHTDVVIVGAGFTGLRAALHLSENKTNVVVLDKYDVGFGASGRNGGQVNPMLPFNSPENIQKLIGNHYFENLCQASLNSADALFEMIAKHKIDCQARQKGWLRVDHCEKARQTSLHNAEGWIKYGAKMEPVEQAEVERLSGSSLYKSGIVATRGGAVQPLSLARGEAKAAINLGAKIFSNSPVTAMKRQGDKWEVKTPQGKVTANWVVLASNGYTDDLHKGLAKTVMPLVSIQVATEPLHDQQIGEILPEGHTISDTRRSIMYSRREPDNRIVFGGHGKLTNNGFVGFEHLIKDATRVFPSLNDVNWKFRWGGKIAITEDRLPHYHEPKPGLIVGLGFNGRGVAMSHVMGKCLADRILDLPVKQLPFPSTKIKGIPFWGIKMMGTGPVVSIMEILDKWESRSAD